MSEWAPCSLCGHERESMCACVNPQCSDYVPPISAPLPEAKAGDLVDRLRGKYTVQINDGAGPLDGKTEITRDFSAFIPPIHLEAAQEIEFLRRWKAEQLAVTAWWQSIDDYCRKHPEMRLGDYVSAFALQKIQERDEMAAALRDFKTALEQLPQHLAFGSEARAVMTTVINRCEILTSPKPVPVHTLSTS